MERIVFLERNTLPIEIRRPAFEHSWTDFGETQIDQIVPRLSEATIAIVNKLPMREAQLSLLPGLKLIAVAATGTDNIDKDFCRTRGIAVCNARNYAVHSVPEHVLTLALALRRNLIAYKHDVGVSKWQAAKQFCLLDHPISDLNGATLGVVGFGSLGQAMARLAQALGMTVIVAERAGSSFIRQGRKPFPKVLETSDVITLHCPLTEQTRGLIDSKELKLMKNSALLINAARGGLVDEVALVRALQDGEIAGAGVDVLSSEPPAQSNPLLEVNLPNLIVTPHVAWASRQAMTSLADQLVDNLEAFVKGEPKNLVE